MVIEYTEHGLQVAASNVEFNELNVTNNVVRFIGHNDNATFAASNFTGGNMISLNGVTYVTFLNCRFKYGDLALSLSSVNGITIQQCSFSNNNIGINIDGSQDTDSNGITIQQCSFSNNNIGINIDDSQDTDISDCLFIHNHQAVQLTTISQPFTTAIDILRNTFDSNGLAVLALLQQNSQLNVANNVFRNSASVWSKYGTSGIYAVLQSECTFNVHSNYFSNLPFNGLQIISSKENTAAKVQISRNSFKNISSTVLTMSYLGSTVTSIEENVFAWNTCQMCPSAISLTLNHPNYWKRVLGNLNVSYNQFFGNTGNYIITVNMYDTVVTPGPDFSSLLFFYNILTDNMANTAVMYSNYYLLDVVFNIFSNTRSTYEFQVGFSGSGNMKENCTNNWWHASDYTGVQIRIFDQSVQTTLGSVVFEPFLSSSRFNCTAVSECSQHGSCILPDICRCDDGWAGPDCSRVSCSSIGECSGHGVCVGPNICSCDDGWASVDCSTPLCYRVNNCGSQVRGTCIAPNRLSTARFNIYSTIICLYKRKS
jgi:EGF-like domain